MNEDSNALMVGMLSGRKNLGWRALEPLNLDQLLLSDGRVSEVQLREARDIQEAVHGFAPDRVPSLGQVLLYTGVMDRWTLAPYALRNTESGNPGSRREETPELPNSQEYRIIFDFELAQA